jgi:hypothetical protein
MRYGLILLLGAAAQAALHPIPRFPVQPPGLSITQPCQGEKPFSVVGQHGAILGQQDGSFEAWLWPTKVLSEFRITAELEDYPVPIDLNQLAAVIDVTPEMTTITYSHAGFTVRQRMFAARGADSGAVAVVFEIDSVRSIELTFRFRLDMMRMWPAPNFGPAGAEWVKEGGYYKVETSDPDISGAIAIPRGTPGIRPFQERARIYPTEIKLRVDPKTDAGLAFPLLFSLVGAKEPADRKLADLNDRVAAMYTGAAAYYQSYLADRLRAETPDKAFDESLRWAEVAIDQARVALHSETGLGAGFYTSGDAYRPGFGWFFGRDAEWTSYAINSYGDFALTRETLAFLIRRQRDDGKMIHEFSQTADLVDWKSRPYFYASADATPLFVMAMEDYVNTSGDVAFLRKNWEAVRRAYEFTRTHDSDDDGIYDNSEGTGWVEDWKPDLPHQEIYLAALDEQSADATSRLASLMDDGALVAAARERAGLIRTRMEAEYYDPQARFYAFSRNKDGTLDRTATIFPAVAWWSGRLALAQPAAMFGRWASSEFSTDWGTRDISPQTQFYDPISYHEGSVWPLYTGWVSLAEYRTGRTLSAYAHLMQNADLTWAQDLGAVTELLSGAFYQTFGRSSSHQTWSSAMVLTPALRGLFGLDWDALHRTLRLAPHLPAAWNSARLVNVRLGESRLDIEYRRVGKQLNMTARSATPEVLCLVKGDAPRDRPCAASPSTTHQLSIDLPPVELGIPHGLPLAGSETTGLKVTSESVSPDRAEFKLEAPAGSRYELPLRIHRSGLRISGGEVAGDKLVVRFPAGSGRQTVAIEAETLP